MRVVVLERHIDAGLQIHRVSRINTQSKYDWLHVYVALVRHIHALGLRKSNLKRISMRETRGNCILHVKQLQVRDKACRFGRCFSTLQNTEVSRLHRPFETPTLDVFWHCRVFGAACSLIAPATLCLSISGSRTAPFRMAKAGLP